MIDMPVFIIILYSYLSKVKRIFKVGCLPFCLGMVDFDAKQKHLGCKKRRGQSEAAII